jgi:hypothetical protein
MRREGNRLEGDGRRGLYGYRGLRKNGKRWSLGSLHHSFRHGIEVRVRIRYKTDARTGYMSAAQRSAVWHGTAQTCDDCKVPCLPCSEIKDGSQKKAHSIGNRVAIIPSNRVTRHTLISVVPDKPQSSVAPHIDIDKEPHHTPLGGFHFFNAMLSGSGVCGLAS